MHGKFIRAAFPEESEQPQYGATQLGFVPLCFVCSCLHTAGCQAYSFPTDGYGIFNVRHKQVCTRVDSEAGIEKLSATLPRQGIEPRVFGFESRRSNTELRPPWPVICLFFSQC